MSFLQILSESFKSATDNPKIRTLAIASAIICNLYISSRFYKRFQRIQRRKKYPKDTVILHQIPRGFKAPSLSPFALKLETW
jgi:hypothetical protein